MYQWKSPYGIFVLLCTGIILEWGAWLSPDYHQTYQKKNTRQGTTGLADRSARAEELIISDIIWESERCFKQVFKNWFSDNIVSERGVRRVIKYTIISHLLVHLILKYFCSERGVSRVIKFVIISHYISTYSNSINLKTEMWVSNNWFSHISVPNGGQAVS